MKALPFLPLLSAKYSILQIHSFRTQKREEKISTTIFHVHTCIVHMESGGGVIIKLLPTIQSKSEGRVNASFACPSFKL
jgi:hypothetical protein